jgi:plastocyanin
MASNMHRLVGKLLPILVLAALVLPVCTAQMTSGGMPQITITEPKEGAQVPAGNVTVRVDVQNFTLIDKLGEASVAGEGHIHYYIDAAVPKTPNKPAVTATGTYFPTANTSLIWMNVTPGDHNLSAQLVNNDHTPLIPLVYATVNITATSPTLKTMSAQSDPQNATIGLVAKNIAFNTSTITVPAGANVTVNFDNQDSGIPHNFAVYTDSSATTTIFKGETITGPKKTTYAFMAPDNPGTYFFRCDTHPTQMTGQFVVT